MKLKIKIVDTPDEKDTVPLKEWVSAKLIDVSEVEGRYGIGYNFSFKPLIGDFNNVRGVVWGPVHREKPIYDWLTILVGEEFESGEEINIDDIVGTVVDVFCESSNTINRNTGKNYVNVVDIRLSKKEKEREKEGNVKSKKKKSKKSKPKPVEEDEEDDDDVPF